MITLHGRQWGTAAEIAAALGPDITPAMVNNWRQRDGLQHHRVGSNVYSPLDQAAQIERDKRLSTRGRRRCLDIAPVLT